jgi:hypothetical protein
MGYLETAVVVYLRAILYPEGFNFPLVTMDQQLAVTEIFREAATIIMLAGIGFLAGRNGSERFAWFIYSFAIWDIFYYVFLKLLLNWPESLMTWDILFLIPVTWVGPVIAPVLVSFTMIVLAVLILRANQHSAHVKISAGEWGFLISGSVVLIVAFTWDYSRFMLQHHSFSEIWSQPQNELFKLSTTYVPKSFNWFIFIAGELLILTGIFSFYKRTK